MVLACIASVTSSFAEDFIVYTAHQNFNSRLYLLHMNGTEFKHYDYSDVRLCGLEVVNNEVYVAEAFCPLVYKFDPYTGNLETVIFDISLYYCYDLCFDGNYFYLDEWDLNRYDINGNKDGTASFDEYVLGAAWDGTYYWTLNDTNQVRCWNISGWPTITEVPSNAFTPPTPDCRGLWFDGQYFWTAEAIDGSLGYIYKFDYEGTAIDQYLEPSFIGWGTCMVSLAGIDEESKKTSCKKPPRFTSISPNPFSDKVKIRIQISENTKMENGNPEISEFPTTLCICDISGRVVRNFPISNFKFPISEVSWDGKDDKGNTLNQGIYFARFECGYKTPVEKVIFIK